MKHSHIYMLFMALAMFVLAACSPDEYSLGSKNYSSDDLVKDKAYTVNVNGNIVTFKSLVTDCTPLWKTPNGASQQKEFSIELPFAGDYEVTFGVETPGGVVYGDPYQFNLPQNDFTLLSDSKYFYLSDKDYKTGAFPDAETLIAGVSKKWYPCNASYGIGQCSGPVMYLNPESVKNDESKATDLTFGSDNWAPNWDPGFQSWLIPEDDPYMDSYMEFSMDAKNGCVAKMYRGESGKKGASSGTNMTGKFNLNVSDKTHPVISFSDCYSMHNVGFDEVCANYTQDIKIIELTPYLLQLATMRTNSEGAWWIVWNFVSEEVIQTQGECIPKDQSVVETAAPVLPTIDDLETKIFTTDINGTTYVGNSMTFTINEEQAYDWWWWTGNASYATVADNWKPVVDGKYNDTWAPKWTDAAIGEELVIAKDTKNGGYTFTYGDKTGKCYFRDGKLVFDRTVTFFKAESNVRTVALTSKEWQVMKCDAGSELVLGIPDGKDSDGNTNAYLVANFNYKSVGATTGPTNVDLDLSSVSSYIWKENNCLRLAFHSYGEDGKGIFKDVTKVKLKKNQTITVKFKINGGATWSTAPKCALIDNNIKTTWEPGCFDLADAVTVNTGGETTVSLTNTTGSTVTFTNTCLDLSIQLDNATLDGDVSGVQIEITSCTIQ